MAHSCRTCCPDCNSPTSELESEIGQVGTIGAVQPFHWIFQAGRLRDRIEKALIEEGDLRRDREVEGGYASHVVAVNMHDVEVALDLLDERIEAFCNDIAIVELDGGGADA